MATNNKKNATIYCLCKQSHNFAMGDGVECTDADMKHITPFLPQRKESAKQESAGLEGTKQLHPQNIKVSNIKKLTIGGVEYKM